MKPLLRERLDPGIEILRLNRPERRNALNTEMLELLVAALRELEVDHGVAGGGAVDDEPAGVVCGR